MDIHIDTNKDSKEEIKRIIKMLQAYIEENISFQNEEDPQNKDFKSVSNPDLFSMFKDDSQSDLSIEEINTKDESKNEPVKEPEVQFIEY